MHLDDSYYDKNGDLIRSKLYVSNDAKYTRHFTILTKEEV